VQGDDRSPIPGEDPIGLSWEPGRERQSRGGCHEPELQQPTMAQIPPTTTTHKHLFLSGS